MTASDEIRLALRDGGGALRLRDHRPLARTIHRLSARGELRALLPGIYCAAEDRDRIGVRLRAAALWAPEAVFTGPAAAWLSGWPGFPVPVITLSRPMRRAPSRGFRICQERLPAEVITRHRSCWITVPALTALDLVPWAGHQGIDEVLRSGTVTVDELWRVLALTAKRHGNGLRRAALQESRNAPWSEAERLLHRILRKAGIRGWAGNVVIDCAGSGYPVDVVFARARLIIEVDGYAYHRAENHDQFHRDRRKWTELAAAGWTVLHLTWDHLVYEPAWVVDRVRRVLGS